MITFWAYISNKQFSKYREFRNIIKCEGGSTSGLHSHVKLMYKIDTRKRPVEKINYAAKEKPKEAKRLYALQI